MEDSGPNFLIVGAAKAGTSSLYAYLQQHPQVQMSAVKEPNYWNFGHENIVFGGPFQPQVSARTWADYAALYPGWPPRPARGEGSVNYLYWPGTAARIAQARPKMKIVALLRQPAERAFSHYVMHRRLGFETAPTFEQALQREPERQARGWHPSWFYRARGVYGPQLQAYAQAFPAHQMRVWLYDDLQNGPAGLLRELCAFLEIDDTFSFDLSRRHNEGGPVPRNPGLFRWVVHHPALGGARRALPASWKAAVKARLAPWMLRRETLSPATRAALTNSCRVDIEAVQTYLDRDLSGWLA